MRSDLSHKGRGDTERVANAVLNSISTRDSLLGVALAQQILREIGERGSR